MVHTKKFLIFILLAIMYTLCINHSVLFLNMGE